MRWLIHHGDILDEPADVLVCSANPYLTLSGGVGGALLLRYGGGLQEELREHLRQRSLRHVPRGSVVSTPAEGTSYRAILHAVAVDALYESSATVVTQVVAAALEQAAVMEAVRQVALAAVATGYGRLRYEAFAVGIRPLMERPFPPLDSVTIVVSKRETAAQLLALLPGSEPSAL